MRSKILRRGKKKSILDKKGGLQPPNPPPPPLYPPLGELMGTWGLMGTWEGLMGPSVGCEISPPGGVIRLRWL